MSDIVPHHKLSLQNPCAGDLDLDGLSSTEKQRILEVVKRSSMLQAMEGQLCKFTNLVKGWQFRWFVLDPQTGNLSYYLDKVNTRCRGTLPLAAAVVSPSEEDSMSFMISAANGDLYKLRAQDAKERQHWINLIRAVAEYHGQNIKPSKSQNNLEKSATTLSVSPKLKNSPSLQKAKSISYKNEHNVLKTPKLVLPENPIQEELRNIKDAINSVIEYHSCAVEAIENGPLTGESTVLPLDEETLILKATSQATVNILKQCYSILQQRSIELQGSANSTKLPPGATIAWFEPHTQRIGRSMSVESRDSFEINSESMKDVVSISEYFHYEVEDDTVCVDKQLEDMESHKSVVLHLLSQLKLGMDLTRVVLPTFVLEKRSLLEMYADFMAHADLFVRIPYESTPEARMISVLEFYLTSFHVGRKSGVAKKPYNPLLGEHFHCSFDTETSKCSDKRVHFVAEQVSHHPPISAFYAESASDGISMNTHIWTKSKFYGMSIGVINVGEGVITLHNSNEEYSITFPNAYCRSILTVPWIELGGRTFIRCAQTGYSAVITFHTKPFYGGQANRITCEVKFCQINDDVGKVVCRGEGYWDGKIELEFTSKQNHKKLIDVNDLAIFNKRVRPLGMQSDFESRKLWSKVTEALQNDDLEKGTEEKHKLEERQRNEAKHRSDAGAEWKTKLFCKHSDGWIINQKIPLLKTKHKKTKSLS